MKMQGLRGMSSELTQRRIEQNAPTGETNILKDYIRQQKTPL
jgi:hypothetical protein